MFINESHQRLICEQGWLGGESSCLPPLCPGPAVICGLSLLVLYSVSRGFSVGSQVFPSHQKRTLEFVLL